MSNDLNLTQQEQQFCQLYVDGVAPYAGNAVKCYVEVFEDESLQAGHRARRLLMRADIKAYIAELANEGGEEAVGVKRYITRNLMNIIDEMSREEFYDSKGERLSTAPLRSVAVNAAKALMDMYPVKVATENKFSIDGGDGDGCGIVFNVIVPEKKNNESEDAKETE